MRRAARVDTVQQEIVEGLRKLGFVVCLIGRPVDLFVGKPLGPGRFKWTPMEVKTCTKSGKRRVRRDQEAQEAFIRETYTPVVMSLAQALGALEALV